jgi:hypothetical protein
VGRCYTVIRLPNGCQINPSGHCYCVDCKEAAALGLPETWIAELQRIAEERGIKMLYLRNIHTQERIIGHVLGQYSGSVLFYEFNKGERTLNRSDWRNIETESLERMAQLASANILHTKRLISHDRGPERP